MAEREHPPTPQLVFDPALCPLLDGLSPEDQAERMESDPVIRACMRKLDATGDQRTGCSVKRAYLKRRSENA